MMPHPKAQSSTGYHPNPNLPLLQVLSSLTQTLLSPSSPLTPEQTLIRLLQKIDPGYFQHKFSHQQAYDYEMITKYVADYYNDRNCERIKKLFLLQLPFVNKFKCIFQLVLDLAMNNNQLEKERYIESIINMGDREKEILMPYFEEVTKRKFIQKLTQFQQYTDTKNIEHTEQDQLLDLKQQQYQELKQNYEELSRSYQELLQNCNSLKQMYEKTLSDNTIILQEKYELMAELGVSPNAHFIDIAEKYKKDVQEYAREVEKLTKDIEERNAKISSKEREIKMINGDFGRLGVWETEKTGMMDRIKRLEAEVKGLESKEGKLRDELQSCREQIAKLRQDIEQKQKQINNLAKTKQKYKVIKEVHLQFKKNFLAKTKGHERGTKQSNQ